MYAGPSFVNVSERELDEGIRHAHAKFPHDVLDRERLRRLANKTSEDFMRAGRKNFVQIRQQVILSMGIPYRSTRYNAYKVALAKIAAMRKRDYGSKPVSASVPLAIDENGPMTPEEIQAHLDQFNLDENYIPVSY